MSSRAARLLATSLILAVVATASGGTESVEEFVRRHWRGPLAPQGPAPARFSLLEASLRPESCGTCHPAQYADWRTSWHAAATGPGVMGQLVEMFESDPTRSEEHTSELQSRLHLVCRLLLEKKKTTKQPQNHVRERRTLQD